MKNKLILITFILILIIVGIIVCFLSNNTEFPTNTNTNTAIIPNIPNNNENVVSFDDITSLPEKYLQEQAIKDNFLVIVHNKYYNKDIYDEFMNDLNKKKDTYLKVMMYTIEGDPIFVKIIYVAKEAKFYACKDNTRDNFSSKEDRVYNYYEFNELKSTDDDSKTFYFINEEGKEIFLFYLPQ